MTRRAGAGATAGPFHFEVVGLGYVEEVVAVRDFEGVGLSFFVDEGYVPFETGLGRGEVAVGVGWGGCEGAEILSGGREWSEELSRVLRTRVIDERISVEPSLPLRSCRRCCTSIVVSALS